MMPVLRKASIFGVLMVAIACGSNSPIAPGPTEPSSLNGAWTGRVEESPGERSGTMRLTFDQTGDGFTGSFSLQFADPSFNRAGSMHGVAQQPPFAVALSSDAADCPVGRVLGGSVLNMTWMRTGDTLLGTYEGFACFGSVNGRFELTR